MPRWSPVALSGMHTRHLGLGAFMPEGGGWQLPARYTSAEEEVERVRRAVGISDISDVGKLSVQGTDLDSLISTVHGEAGALEVGAIRRGHIDDGAGAGEVLLARLAGDELLVVTGPQAVSAVSESLSTAADGCLHVVDVTSGFAGVRIAGPLAQRLLEAVTELDLSPGAFADMACAQTSVAEIHGTILRRDAASLPGFDLYFSREYGEYMWDALMEAGEQHDASPFGTEALSLLESHHRGHGDHGDHGEGRNR